MIDLEQLKQNPKSGTSLSVLLMRVMVIISSISIIAAIFVYFQNLSIFHDGNIINAFFSLLFLFSIVFFGIHSIGFYMNTIRSLGSYVPTIEHFFLRHCRKVAVLVPTFNEPIDMFRDNIVAVVKAAKTVGGTVYVLDDSTNKEISNLVKEECDYYKINYVHRENRHGYKAGAINDFLKSIDVDELETKNDEFEFVCILDADQHPQSNFLEEVLHILDENPKLALVQVPQHYKNTDGSILSMASQAQQFIFYDIITEGKCMLGTLFSCGTNIVYRKEALKSVGYFDETSITEDLATTINLHLKGWETFYYNPPNSKDPLVYGRAPTELAQYFNQQARWALGTLSLTKKVFSKIIKNKSFSWMYKFDYLLSTSWYLCGWAYLIQMILPIAFLLGNVKPVTVDLMSFLVIILPYTIFTLATLLLTVIKSGNPLKFVFYNLSMNIISFPITISASIQALRSKRNKPFVTARTGGKLPWIKLWPHFLMISLLSVSFIKGVIFDLGSWFHIVNIVGVAFHLAMLLPIFKLNSGSVKTHFDLDHFS